MNFWRARNIIIILGVVLLVTIGTIVLFAGGSEEEVRPTRTLSDVIADAREGLVAEIGVDGNSLTVRMKNGQEFESRKEQNTSIVVVLASNDVEVGGADGVVVEVHGPSSFGSWLGILISFLPIFVIGAVIFYAVRWGTRRRG